MIVVVAVVAVVVPTVATGSGELPFWLAAAAATVAGVTVANAVAFAAA